MSRNLDPNFIKMQQEVLRHKNLERAKKTAPDWKRDKKILITVAVVLAAIFVFAIISQILWP